MTADVLPGSGRDAWQSDEEWEPPWSGFERGEPTTIELVPDTGPSNGTAAADRAKPETQRAEGLSTWSPVDLAAVLAGDTSPLMPTQLARGDGLKLLYPAKVHAFLGEPETFKSLLAQIAIAEVLLDGGQAIYVDHEGEARDVVGHLLAFNVPTEVIVAGLSYIRPDESSEAPLDVPGLSDISVIDGVDAAMALQGLNPNNALDYHKWARLEVKPLQRATSGATILIDHVPKNKETRGDWAAGTYAKKGGIDVTFGLQLVEDFGRGRVGVARILLNKDRPGALRSHQGAGREIAKLRLTSHYPDDDMITWELLPPAVASDAAGDTVSHWQPTGLMERVSRLLEGSISPLSKNAIETAVPGKRDYIRLAVDYLVEGAYVEAFAGANRARLHRSIRPYREDDKPSEPSSPQVRPNFAPGEPDDEFAPSPSPLRGGEDTPTPLNSLLDAEFAPGGRQHIEAISQ